MKISEQVLSLLDIPTPNKTSHDFSGLENTVNESFGTIEPEIQPLEAPAANPYSFASRMTKSNNDDQLRAEALMTALQKIRAGNNVAKSKPSSRIIKGA